MSDDRQLRADIRRATWTGTTVDSRTARTTAPLYQEMRVEERLQAFVALNRRVWRWAEGEARQPTDRSEWPGEVIDLLAETHG